MSEKRIIGSTALRQELARVLKAVHNQNAHITIERDGYPLAVLVPLADYEKMRGQQAKNGCIDGAKHDK